MLPSVCLAPAKISGTILHGELLILVPARRAKWEGDVGEPTSQGSKPAIPGAAAALTAVR